MSLQTRIWHHIRDCKRKKTVFISLEKIWGQMESKWFIFHFCGFSFTKRFHFCFKDPNNFQSERKSEKRIIFGAENVAHVVKSCDGFIFWTFHEPLVKSLRNLPKFSHVNLARENLGWDEHGNFTFSDENHQNASRREIFLPNRLWNSQNVTQKHNFESLFTKPY